MDCHFMNRSNSVQDLIIVKGIKYYFLTEKNIFVLLQQQISLMSHSTCGQGFVSLSQAVGCVWSLMRLRVVLR
jgi:hypothetical protein